MKSYLDLEGVTLLWSKVKGLIKRITDKFGVANGIATLDNNSKLTISQLPDLKTVNNQSIVGSGNINIDLALYRIVNSLPTTNQDPTKIYLVVNADGVEGDTYSEYVYINSEWELLGQHKADIDLSGYVRFTDIVTTSENGSMSKEDKTKLDGIQVGATSDKGIPLSELDVIFKG